jgi:hypothetical protein
MHSQNARTSATLLALLALVATGAPVRAQKQQEKQDSKRPHLTLKAQPSMGTAPLRVTMLADLAGGANDLEEFYCATAIWDWGDGGSSEKSTDCEPYEKGKSEIRRRYAEEHTFRRSGYYRVYFALEKRDKEIVTGWVNIAVQAGNSN